MVVANAYHGPRQHSKGKTPVAKIAKAMKRSGRCYSPEGDGVRSSYWTSTLIALFWTVCHGPAGQALISTGGSHCDSLGPETTCTVIGETVLDLTGKYKPAANFARSTNA